MRVVVVMLRKSSSCLLTCWATMVTVCVYVCVCGGGGGGGGERERER